MAKLSLRVIDNNYDEETEKRIISDYISDMIEICSNPLRAGILNLLIKSPSTGHALKVEDIAFSLGTYHRIVLHHLERLEKWDLVEVRRKKKYGDKVKRSVWGLKLDYPNWIFEVYNTIKTGFTEYELKRICNRNKNMRNGIKNIRLARSKGKGIRNTMIGG